MSLSDQDVRIDGTSIMTRKFWIADRSGLDMTPGFRSTNFDVAYLQGSMWKVKQIPEVVRSIAMIVDSCDEDGVYPTTGLGRLAQMNSNMHELTALFAREGNQVTVERDVLVSDGSLGYEYETWTGLAQASAPIIPVASDDFPDFRTLGIDLLFADPMWYGEEVTETVSGSETINNPGPTDATNLLLTFSGGADYRLTNTSTLPEDTWVQIDRTGNIVIDVRNGTAVRGGDTNVIGDLSHDGSRVFMRLIPGDNDLVLTGGGSVDITYSPPRG